MRCLSTHSLTLSLVSCRRPQFHSALEAQHAEHTMDELEEAYAAGRITDEAKFEAAANEMLDACQVFWMGLDAARKGEDFVVDEANSGYGI